MESWSSRKASPSGEVPAPSFIQPIWICEELELYSTPSAQIVPPTIGSGCAYVMPRVPLACGIPTGIGAAHAVLPAPPLRYRMKACLFVRSRAVTIMLLLGSQAAAGRPVALPKICTGEDHVAPLSVEVLRPIAEAVP